MACLLLQVQFFHWSPSHKIPWWDNCSEILITIQWWWWWRKTFWKNWYVLENNNNGHDQKTNANIMIVFIFLSRTVESLRTEIFSLSCTCAPGGEFRKKSRLFRASIGPDLSPPVAPLCASLKALQRRYLFLQHSNDTVDFLLPFSDSNWSSGN